MCSEPPEAFSQRDTSAPPLHHHYKLSASPAPLQPPLRLSPSVIVSPLSLIVTQPLRKTPRNDEKSFSALCLCNFSPRDRQHCFIISMVTHQRLSRQSKRVQLVFVPPTSNLTTHFFSVSQTPSNLTDALTSPTSH